MEINYNSGNQPQNGWGGFGLLSRYKTSVNYRWKGEVPINTTYTQYYHDMQKLANLYELMLKKKTKKTKTKKTVVSSFSEKQVDRLLLI